jgi:hypothetical protein
MSRSRSAGLRRLAGLLLLVACSEAPPEGGFTATGSVACEAAARSRWASSGRGYRKTAEYGLATSRWLGGLAGVAHAESVLVASDLSQPQVLILDPGLERARSFGRSGDGPGELARFSPQMLSVTSPDWTAVRGDTIIVYDGERLSKFALDGRHLGYIAREGELARLAPGESRLRATPEGVFFPIGGYLSPETRPENPVPWSLKRLAGQMVYGVLDLSLPALPRRQGGSTVRVGLQAVPLWDVHGGCVIAADGQGRWLVRATTDGVNRDRIPVHLPDPRRSEAELAEERMLAGQASPGRTKLPEPTALRRIQALIVDPDGFVWLLPVQPDWRAASELEVYLVSLATAETVVDTVPSFPKVFGSSGTYYGEIRGPDREVVLARFDRVK